MYLSASYILILMDKAEERILFEELKKGSKVAFSQLFHRYYSYLCNYATVILKDDDSAEDIVQGFFVILWEKRDTITIDTSVKSYLFRSVKNRCINQLQHLSLKAGFVNKSITLAETGEYDFDNFPDPELADLIEKSIGSLPEKRREIFRLSREDGLKYKEIAEKLNISIKTVEAQIGLAFKSLREMLKDFKTGFVLFLFFSKLE